MKAEGLPNLETYDVLWTLEQADRCALRLNDLGEKVFIARFNVTRICDKLEEQGLIEKVKCPMDKRGVHAALTDEGKALRKKMWDFYSKQIEEKFSSKLTTEDHEMLMKILLKIGIVS